MLMRPDNRAVDHHVFIVVIGSQIEKNPLDHTAFTQAAQTPMHVFPVTKTVQKGHAMECPNDSDTAQLPQTDGYQQPCRRHGLHDREEGPLSAPTGHRANCSAASFCLPKAQKTVSTEQQKVQSLWSPNIQALTDDTP